MAHVPVAGVAAHDEHVAGGAGEEELVELRQRKAEAKPIHVQQKALGFRILKTRKALDTAREEREAAQKALQAAEGKVAVEAKRLAELEEEDKKLHEKALGAGDSVEGTKVRATAMVADIRKQYATEGIAQCAEEVFDTITKSLEALEQMAKEAKVEKAKSEAAAGVAAPAPAPCQA